MGGYWRTWPDLVGQLSVIPMTIAICLCGTPQTPNIGGVRGGHTPNAELVTLRDSLDQAQKSLDGTTVLKGSEAELAQPESLDVLARRLDVLEKKAGQWLARTNLSRHSPRGRYWAPPERKPDSGSDGTLTRDKLVRELQKRGLLFREGRRAVQVILSALSQHLQFGGELKTLLGKFHIKRRPQPKQLERFGRTVTINQQPKRVAFQLDRQLKAALQSAPEIPMPETEVYDPLRCEKCGSLEFTEARFHQYTRDFYAAMPGGDLVPATETPIRTLVCLCGNPVLPGSLRFYSGPELVSSFKASFAVAQQYRETQLPAMVGKLAERFARKHQHDSLAERITNLERMLQDSEKEPQ